MKPLEGWFRRNIRAFPENKQEFAGCQHSSSTAVSGTGNEEVSGEIDVFGAGALWC